MTTSDYFLCLLGAAIVFMIGLALLIANKVKKKNTGKSNLPLILIGWILIAAALIGAVIATIISTFDTSGTIGVFLLIGIGGLFIFMGLIVFLGIGISSLVDGLRKDKNGNINKEGAVRGATLLVLAVAILITVVVTILIMLQIESNK